MMKVHDDSCSVNKRKCGWRVSAEMMFSGRNFGGQVPLRSRDSGPSNRAFWSLTSDYLSETAALLVSFQRSLLKRLGHPQPAQKCRF